MNAVEFGNQFPLFAVFAGGLLFPMAAGLMSSFTHCAGMCGPIHFYFAARQGKQVYAYHLGRITTYALLGLLAGWLGQKILSPETLGLPSVMRLGASIVAGLYVLMALRFLGVDAINRFFEKGAARLSSHRLFRHLIKQEGNGSTLFAAGLVGGLLPCPTTQAVLVYSVGLGNPFAGSFAMLALGVSTLPVFIALLPRLAKGPKAGIWLYHRALGVFFVALAGWRIHGAWFADVPHCH